MDSPFSRAPYRGQAHPAPHCEVAQSRHRRRWTQNAWHMWRSARCGQLGPVIVCRSRVKNWIFRIARACRWHPRCPLPETTARLAGQLSKEAKRFLMRPEGLRSLRIAGRCSSAIAGAPEYSRPIAEICGKHNGTSPTTGHDAAKPVLETQNGQCCRENTLEGARAYSLSAAIMCVTFGVPSS